MFLASDVETQVKVLLDDTQSSRYTFADDIRPAINLAVPYILTVIASAFEASLIQSSALAELIRIYVGLASVTHNEASLDLSDPSYFPDGIFRVLGVEIQPHYYDFMGDPDLRRYQATAGSMAARLTLEEWGDNISNPFKPGNSVSQPTSLKKGGYMYHGGSSDAKWITFRPATMLDSVEPVLGVWYITNPTPVTANTDSIDLPMACLPFVVDKVVNYISMQQGNRQSLFIVTERDMSTLASLFVR